MTRPSESRTEVPTDRTALRRRIVEGARVCFRRDGVRRATMESVAKESGITRQSLYKIFFGRKELVAAAVIQRIREIADELPAAPEFDDDFAGEFVGISVAVIEGIRNDPELALLFEAGSPVTPHEALWSQELTERGLTFWIPWLTRARAAGVLRQDLSDRDLSDWLHTVYVSIILRQNIPAPDERVLIERFVLTSLAMVAPPN